MGEAAAVDLAGGILAASVHRSMVEALLQQTVKYVARVEMAGHAYSLCLSKYALHLVGESGMSVSTYLYRQVTSVVVNQHDDVSFLMSISPDSALSNAHSGKAAKKKTKSGARPQTLLLRCLHRDTVLNEIQILWRTDSILRLHTVRVFPLRTAIFVSDNNAGTSAEHTKHAPQQQHAKVALGPGKMDGVPSTAPPAHATYSCGSYTLFVSDRFVPKPRRLNDAEMRFGVVSCDAMLSILVSEPFSLYDYAEFSVRNAAEQVALAQCELMLADPTPGTTPMQAMAVPAMPGSPPSPASLRLAGDAGNNDDCGYGAGDDDPAADDDDGIGDDEQEQADALARTNFTIVSSQSVRKAVISRADPSQWSCWRVHMRTHNRDIYVVIARRMLLPPYADAAEDVVLVCHGPMNDADVQETEVQVLEREFYQWHIDKMVLNSISLANPALHQYDVETLQVLADNLLLPAPALQWADQQLGIRPAVFPIVLDIARTLMRVLRAHARSGDVFNEADLPNPPAAKTAAPTVAAAEGNGAAAGAPLSPVICVSPPSREASRRSGMLADGHGSDSDDVNGYSGGGGGGGGVSSVASNDERGLGSEYERLVAELHAAHPENSRFLPAKLQAGPQSAQWHDRVAAVLSVYLDGYLAPSLTIDALVSFVHQSNAPQSLRTSVEWLLEYLCALRVVDNLVASPVGSDLVDVSDTISMIHQMKARFSCNERYVARLLPLQFFQRLLGESGSHVMLSTLLVGCLAPERDPELLRYACDTVALLASGTSVHATLVDNGIPTLLMRLALCQDARIVDAATAALVNMAAHHSDVKDVVVQSDHLAALLSHLSPLSSPKFLRHLATLIKNCSATDEQRQALAPAVPLLVRLVRQAPTGATADTDMRVAVFSALWNLATARSVREMLRLGLLSTLQHAITTLSEASPVLPKAVGCMMLVLRYHAPSRGRVDLALGARLLSQIKPATGTSLVRAAAGVLIALCSIPAHLARINADPHLAVALRRMDALALTDANGAAMVRQLRAALAAKLADPATSATQTRVEAAAASAVDGKKRRKASKAKLRVMANAAAASAASAAPISPSSMPDVRT